MTNIQYKHRHLEVTCELQAAEEVRARTAEWQQLRDQGGLGTDSIPGGARLWLRSAARDAADSLARREAACCGFLDFDLDLEDGRLRLDITSPAPEAEPIIACLVGFDVKGVLQCC